MEANFAVTGVGSLPFESVLEAITDIDRNAPLLPYTPQLPRVGRFGQMLLEPFLGLEDLIIAGEEGGKAAIRKGELDTLVRRIDEIERQPYTEPNVCAMREHLLAARASGTGAMQSSAKQLGIKTQLVGPITLLTQLQYCGKPVISDPDAAAAVVSLLTDRIAKQCETLKTLGSEIVFILDEPVLPFLRKADLAPKGTAVRSLDRALRAVRDCGARAGIHSCAPLPGPFLHALLENLGVTVLSIAIDSSAEIEQIVHPPLVRNVLERGMMLWGIVPTVCSKPTSAVALVEWLKSAQTILDIPDGPFHAHSLITPQCGTGLLTSEQSEKVFGMCREVSEIMRCR